MAKFGLLENQEKHIFTLAILKIFLANSR
jgi:hypothetical protein